MSISEVVIVVVAATVGSISQSCTGIGFGLLAGPVLVGIDADFAPGPLMAPTLLITARHVVVERHHLDRRGIVRMAIGAPVGLAGGLAVLTAISDRALTLLIGAVVVLAAVVVLSGVAPRPTSRRMIGVGALTAFTGVAAGLPGPPIAIAYHDAQPPRLRSTGSLFITVFIVVATALMVMVGEFGGREAGLSLLLVPPIIFGLFAARYIRPLIDATIFRPVILVLAGLGGLALILRNL